MLPIGHQVQVIGEADNLGQSLQDVNAEALAALFQGSHTLMDGTVKVLHSRDINPPQKMY